MFSSLLPVFFQKEAGPSPPAFGNGRPLTRPFLFFRHNFLFSRPPVVSQDILGFTVFFLFFSEEHFLTGSISPLVG